MGSTRHSSTNVRGVMNIRHSVCAIEFQKSSDEELRKDPLRPHFEIMGTGFLIRDTTVITNRHVIEDLMQKKKARRYGHHQLKLMFVYPPRSYPGILSNFCGVEKLSIIEDEGVDIGFVDFNRKSFESWNADLRVASAT